MSEKEVKETLVIGSAKTREHAELIIKSLKKTAFQTVRFQ